MPFKDPEQRKRWFRQHYHDLRKMVRDYKENNPCMDCLKHYPFYVMDFDHVRGEKFKNLAGMHTYSQARVDLEMQKCDLVCANCHRIRTHKRLSLTGGIVDTPDLNSGIV